MALVVSAQNFQKEVLQSTKPVIVDVYASWCGPCRQMMPIFEAMSQELGAQYVFTKLNIDEERDLAIQYSVTSIPTLLFFKGGKLVGKEMGYMNQDALKKAIDRLFA